MTGIDREALEAERDFLLRSLDDLEEERADGNVDDGTYRELHDDYTARAAAVIRSLDAGTRSHRARTAPGVDAQRALTVGGIVVFALVAAVLLSHAVRAAPRRARRSPGTRRWRRARPRTGGDSGRRLAAAAEAAAEELRGAHRVRALPHPEQQLRRRGPGVRRRGPARPEPTRAARPTRAGPGALVSQQVGDAEAEPGTALGFARAHQRRDQSAIRSTPTRYALKGVILFKFEHERPAMPYRPSSSTSS